MKGQGSHRKPLKDALAEARLFRTRAAIGFALIALAMSLIGARFAWLQVAQHEEFTTRSEANRVRLRALPPNRGLVYDRQGRLLADNRPAYRLQLVPEQVDEDDLRDTLALILDDLTHAEAAEVLEVSEGTISWRMSEIKKQLAQLRAAEEQA